MNSIKLRLTAGLSLLIAVPFIIIYLIIFTQVSAQSVQDFSRASNNEIKQVDRAISILLDEAKKNVTMIADSPLNEQIDENVTNYVGPEEKPRTPAPDDVYGQQMSPLLKWIQTAHPSYDSVYIGTKWGGNVLSNTAGTRKNYDPTKRPWWTIALKDPSEAQVSAAYRGTTGDPMLSVVKAYQRGGQTTAVAAVDLTLKALSDLMQTIRLGETGYVILVQGDGTVIANPRNKEMNFKQLGELPEKTYNELFGIGSGQAEVEIGGVPHLAQVFTSDYLGWRFIGLIETQEVLSGVNDLLLQIGLVMGLSLIIILVVMWFYINGTIINPISTIVRFLNQAASGDYTQRVTAKRKDEIGTILNALNTMSAKLGEVVNEIMDGSARVAAGSEELSATAESLADGATRQASSLEEVSSSMEEMASNIEATAQNAHDTEGIARSSSVNAEEGGGAVAETVEAMKQIAEKISIIEDIARQTNLLALNAAIEAARAGEHGKGFAVVAAEVRKLAERSGLAAAEISELSTNSVAVAEKAGKMLGGLVPDIQKTADLIQEISLASNEQNAGAEQINAALQQLDSVVQQNASASEQMASTSHDLAGQASQLQQTISFFRVGNVPSSTPRPDTPGTGRVALPPVNAQDPKAFGADIRMDLSDDTFEKF